MVTRKKLKAFSPASGPNIFTLIMLLSLMYIIPDRYRVFWNILQSTYAFLSMQNKNVILCIEVCTYPLSYLFFWDSRLNNSSSLTLFFFISYRCADQWKDFHFSHSIAWECELWEYGFFLQKRNSLFWNCRFDLKIHILISFSWIMDCPLKISGHLFPTSITHL